MILSSQRRREGTRAWVALALVGLIGAGLVWRLQGGGPQAPALASGQGASAPGAGLHTWQQGGTRPAEHAASSAAWGAGGGTQPVWQDSATLEVTRRFQVRDGQLVLDAGTLRTLEQVLAFQDARGLAHKASEVAQGLPAALQAQAVELAERYGRFDQARRMAVSPDQAPTSVAQMQAQFDALQALQREHFGPQVAAQLFAEDDAVTARLLQFMAEDTDGAASLEDKAARAQARYTAEVSRANP